MTERSEAMKSRIDAAFDEAGSAEGHHQCVRDCRASYELCLDAGGHNCRGDLESCINGCPNGLVGGLGALQTLLDRLEQIESDAG